jgi:pimeloyl-ACP methyl ester carboxylesterase
VNHAERLAGVVLYASAAATGVEFNAESVRQLAAFTARNAFNPELPDVLSQLRSIGSLRDDRSLTSALRGLLPAYLADYWGRREEFSTLRRAIRVSYISNLDSRLYPENIDDRMVLPTLTVPTLVVAGRYDIVCGPRWAMELHSLIRDSRVLILEQSGHFGHLEEPGEFTDGVMGFVRSLADLRPSAGVDR